MNGDRDPAASTGDLSFGEWPERIPGDEAGDMEYAITREEWVVATTLRSRDRTADPPLHPRQRDL